ncbi:MAG: hypothetical protein R3F61_06095 [Myxococcota bacterium]
MLPLSAIPVLALLSACGPVPVDLPDGVSPDTSDAAADLVALLEGELDGVEVSEGEVVPLDGSGCGNDECPGGANLSSPYGMWTFPDDPPPTDGALTFQLGLDEALVYVGETPPPARYFSYTLYLYERTLPSGEIVTGRGSIAPSLNHRVVRLAGEPASPFSQLVIVVVAASPDVANRTLAVMRPTLERHGVLGAVNLLAIPWRSVQAAEALRADPDRDPDSIVDFQPGHGPSADHYMVAWRTADPVDPAHPFFDPEHPTGEVFRLHFDDPDPATAFRYPDLPPDDTSEVAEGPEVGAARDAVVTELLRAQAQNGLDGIVLGTTNGPRKSGFLCANGLEGCFLNSDDARYLRDGRPVRMRTTRSALFLVGVLHDEVQTVISGAADVSYSNVSVVDRDAGAETIASSMDRELAGSARAWLPAGVEGVSDALLDTLFVLKVARHCKESDPVCVEVPLTDVGPETRIGWTERVYLNEATHTAPPPSAVWPLLGVGVGPDLEEKADVVDLD